MDSTTPVKQLSVFLTLLVTPGLALAFAISFSAEVTCTNGGSVVEQGGEMFPSASCKEPTNRGGFFPLRGETEAKAEARFGPRSVGVLADARADIFDGIDTFQAEALASANLQDTFIMSATLPDGSPIAAGLLDVSLVATGMMLINTTQTSGIPNFAELTYSLSIGTFSLPETITLTPPIDIRGFASPVNVISIPWTAGVLLSVSMSASTSVSAAVFGEGFSDAEVQFGNSFEWLEIVNVRDESGNPAASFSAVGEDGLDWGSPLAAVPLPATAWLFCTGIIGLIGLARRKQ